MKRSEPGPFPLGKYEITGGGGATLQFGKEGYVNFVAGVSRWLLRFTSTEDRLVLQVLNASNRQCVQEIAMFGWTFDGSRVRLTHLKGTCDDLNGFASRPLDGWLRIP